MVSSSAPLVVAPPSAATSLSPQMQAKTSHQLKVNSGESVWTQVLEGTWKKGKDQNDENAHIVILGHPDTGKSALIQALQQIGSKETLTASEKYENTGAISAIDCAFISSRRLDSVSGDGDAGDGDDIISAEVEGRVCVWILQNELYKEILIKRLKAKKNSVKRMVFVICVDLARAWCLMTHLQTWMRCAADIAQELLQDIDIDEQIEMKARMVRYLLNYKKNALHEFTSSGTGAFNLDVPVGVDHGGSTDASGSDRSFGHSLQTTSTSSKLQVPSVTSSGANAGVSGLSNDSEVSIEVEQSVLQSNQGIPIVTAVCRSDSVHLIDTRLHPGQVDVIEMYLRRECLNYQSALLYCNVREDHKPVNAILLYRYLMHLLFYFPFREQPQTGYKENLFFPAGWDNDSVIEEGVKNTVVGDFTRPYESIVVRPSSNSQHGKRRTSDGEGSSVPVTPHETQAVIVDSMNDFLRRLVEQHPNLRSEKGPTVRSVDGIHTQRSMELSGRFHSKSSMNPPLSKGDSIGNGSGRLPLSPGRERPSVADASKRRTTAFLSSTGSGTFARSGSGTSRSGSHEPRSPRLDNSGGKGSMPSRSGGYNEGSSTARGSRGDDKGGASASTASADQANLQSFFQGLLAKGRQNMETKGATPRDSSGRRRERPSVAPSTTSSNGSGTNRPPVPPQSNSAETSS